MKKLKRLIILVFLFITSIFVLSSCDNNNPDNCVHDWLPPTCLEPAQCRKCDAYKPDGILGNHNYRPATCREPAKCMYCYVYKDDILGTHEFSSETGYCYHCGISRDSSKNPNNTCANGHTNGDWIVIKNPTLVDNGTEEMSCNVCDELIDTRTIQMKLPQVADNYFNFNDAELIEWINDISTAFVYSTDLGIFEEDSTNTSYKIVMSDGEAGALLLTHGDNGKNGNIQTIMIYFSDNTLSGAMGTWLGNKIDSDFDLDDSANKWAYYQPYTAANMTGIPLELYDDFEVYLLAPSKYIDDL